MDAPQKHKIFEKEALVHLDAMFGLAYSLTRNRAKAEDLVQESILKAYRAFNTFEQGTYMKAWLFRIVKNTFISQWRKAKVRPESKEIDDENFKSFYGEVYEQIPKKDNGVPAEEVLDPEKLEHVLGDEIKQALEQLSEEYREVIYLCDIQEMSYQDIADILEIPIGTVRSRLARARKQLQKMLWRYAKDKGLWRRVES